MITGTSRSKTEKVDCLNQILTYANLVQIGGRFAWRRIQTILSCPDLYDQTPCQIRKV
jgi:hypothetical protein